MIYIALLITIVLCYFLFRRTEEKNIQQYSHLENLIEEVQEKNSTLDNQISNSNQIFELNHKLDFYLNNLSLVEKFGFDTALKLYLQEFFKKKGYNKNQAEFKALLVTEKMPFTQIVLEFFSSKKTITNSDLEEKFRSLLKEIEFEKEFFNRDKLKQYAYCVIKQITEDKKLIKKDSIFFQTFHPMDLLENNYHLFLEKFFLLDYLISNGLITRIDYKKQDELGLYCLASVLCLKVNKKEASKFLDDNKDIESKCNKQDIDWFSYGPA